MKTIREQSEPKECDEQTHYEAKSYLTQYAIYDSRNEPVVGISQIAEMFKTEWSEAEVEALIRDLGGKL